MIYDQNSLKRFNGIFTADIKCYFQYYIFKLKKKLKTISRSRKSMLKPAFSSLKSEILLKEIYFQKKIEKIFLLKSFSSGKFVLLLTASHVSFIYCVQG